MFTDILEAKKWLLSLSHKNVDNNQLNTLLETFHHPEKIFLKVRILGENDLVEAFMSKAIDENGKSVGSLNASCFDVANQWITYNGKPINDHDFLYLINRLFEINGQTIGFFDGLAAISMLYFANMKTDVVFVRDEIDLDYELNVVTSNIDCELKGLVVATEEYRGEAKKLFNKDVFVYPCELCSFEYEGNIYDLDMMGIHFAYEASLAIFAVYELYPNIKRKTLKRALENIAYHDFLERVNLRPRVILWTIKNSLSITKGLLTINRYPSKKILMYQESFEGIEGIAADSLDEIKNFIRQAKDNDVIIIMGKIDNIKEIRLMFNN